MWAAGAAGTFPMSAAISLCMVLVLAMATTFILRFARRGSDV
ncbi:hypothetical protein [Reyranella sp.]